VSNHDEQPPQYELALKRTIWVAGRRFHPRASLGPGEAVNLVREPKNLHDANAIAVVTIAGERAGYLPREEAGEWAVLVDEGIIQLTARLVAAGEPDFDGARFAVNPRIYLSVYVDQRRLDELTAQAVAGS
jgi:hypothetical protein